MNPPSRFRSVITGGPGVGKSTLLEALADAGIATFAEVARKILQVPGGMEMRAQRPMDFAEAMLEAELSAWHAAAVGAAVYDRGFPDIVGFFELEGLPVPNALDRCCRELRYEGPIFRAPPWAEIYAPDEERIQDWAQALASDSAVTAAWKRYGYQLVDLPLLPVAQRVEFVLDYLGLKQ
jgi:predicted ATPase